MAESINITAVRRQQQMALCELLGLDPATTSSIKVEWVASPRGARPVASWSGVRRLSDEQVEKLGLLLAGSEPGS